jgi:hypothetical protein
MTFSPAAHAHRLEQRVHAPATIIRPKDPLKEMSRG